MVGQIFLSAHVSTGKKLRCRRGLRRSGFDPLAKAGRVGASAKADACPTMNLKLCLSAEH
jgi:hypothetical protein